MLLFFQIKAQDIIQIKDSINGTVYTITMDNRINHLLTEAENRSKEKGTHSEGDDPRRNILPKFIKDKGVIMPIPSKKISIADVCKDSPKLKGYKIQITVTNNRVKADKLRYSVREYFPNLRTELDSSLRPNYKILAGSYFSKQSGNEDLKRV